MADGNQTEQRVLAAYRHGFSVHLHATGDGAVRFALDCYEKAIAAYGPTTSRLSIEHCDLVDPADLPRFGKLGIIASVQPTVMVAAETYAQSPYLAVVGKAWEQHLWGFASLLKNGAILAAGTDFPVVEINQLRGIYQAICRLYPDGTPPGGFYPQENLTRTQIVKAYTWGSAYMAGQEQQLGTLEPGKLADLTILDGNIFELEPQQLLATKVLATVVDGQLVYEN